LEIAFSGLSQEYSMPIDMDNYGLAAMRLVSVKLFEDLGLNLTLLQFAVFLTCYLDYEQEYTVRDLVEELNCNQVNVLRAVRRLVDLDLVDCDFSADSRPPVGRTEAGIELLTKFHATVKHAARMALQ
jgi:DNA-binding MarR family transcriptional regulator